MLKNSKLQVPAFCSLHLVAKEFAIEASKVFFREIRTAVGDEKFAKFLNLKSDHTLAFVIDVSGSMRGVY